MATNEIAAAVQCGQANVLELWRMCRRYAMQQATRWHRAFKRSGGVELDDLEQSAFIGLLKAVQTWKPESGAILHLVHSSAKGGICRGLRDEDETNTRRSAQ